MVKGDIFDFESRASDREFVGDAGYIHLETEALHRRAREMLGQTARGGCAADDLVGEERMDVKDRIDLGSGHVRPAEAERRHAQLYRSEQWTVWRSIRSLRKPASWGSRLCF